jgi:hypothetical protein
MPSSLFWSVVLDHDHDTNQEWQMGTHGMYSALVVVCVREKRTYTDFAPSKRIYCAMGSSTGEWATSHDDDDDGGNDLMDDS